MSDSARICDYCKEPADGRLLPAYPDRPDGPHIAEDHERCNRARLMAMLTRAADQSSERLAAKAAAAR